MKILKRTMIILISIALLLVVTTFSYMQHPKFGKSPEGARLEKIKKSPHYKNGSFQNLSITPVLSQGHNYFEVIYNNYIRNKPRHIPTDPIPSVKTDLLNLPIDSEVLIWFGHSSYYLQIDGKRILVDPVFSGNASPLPQTLKSFKGTDVYTVADLPEIDFLFISHDHYDHVDYETLVALKEKTKKVICGLGVGSHFEHWGYAPEKIVERDWYEKAELDTEFTAFVEPARHFSGRAFSRNNTLWVSYVLQTPTLTIYIGGDSGYGIHYEAIGNKYGPFDLAILDNGQYDEAWKEIHHHPVEVLKAGQALKASRIFPVHSSKFALAAHPWSEPLEKITELNKSYNFALVTPKIGELVKLKDANQRFKPWWRGVN